MIRQVCDGENICDMLVGSTEARKIYALWLCYEAKYDFCRFYRSENSVFCSLDGDVILSCTDNFSNDEISELGEFLAFCGFKEIFCSDVVGARLAEIMDVDCKNVHLMRFLGIARAETDKTLEKNISLTELYAVISLAFGLPQESFETWYLDISHRVRHGVSETRRLGNSVLVIQHNIENEVLLSQIATAPENQGYGSASRLIKAVCGEFPGSDVTVVCEEKLKGFYEKNGFLKIADKCIISSR